MKKKINIFLLSFIFFISSLLPCISVYAQGNAWTAEEKVRYVGNAFYKIFTDISGVLVPSGLNGSDLQRDFQAYVLNSDVIQDNMTYDEWIASEIGIIYQNGSSGNADITYSPTFQNTINNFAHDWIEENEGYLYGYSWSCSAFISYYKNQAYYDSFLSKIRELDNSLCVATGYYGDSNSGYYVSYINEYFDNPSFVLISNNGEYYLKLFSNWSDRNINYRTWTFNDRTNTWTSSDDLVANNVSIYLSMTDSPAISSMNPYNVNKVVDVNSSQYIIYKSFSGLQNSTLGVQSYYVTDSFNSNWQDNSITDSYNTTTTAVNNTISYQDVSNYVNNYYVENNSYPTSNTVYNYINNYVPPDNGGSGGDNGGGGSNIFDFLGTIGDFLGNLIQGIGNVISGILSALTDVIDMFIGENGLPNVIGQLISYFLPFLPEWVPTVIGLSVTLALLIGIVKLIRGS